MEWERETNKASKNATDAIIAQNRIQTEHIVQWNVYYGHRSWRDLFELLVIYLYYSVWASIRHG